MATRASESSNRKRSNSSSHKHTDDEDQKNATKNTDSTIKRTRVEFEQTGYARGMIPEKFLGATDMYDGELMFL